MTTITARAEYLNTVHNRWMPVPRHWVNTSIYDWTHQIRLNAKGKAKLEFTTDAYLRSHGKEPKGSGCWFFQKATSRTAFSSQLIGTPRSFGGTLTEAKKALRATGENGLWAVLP